MFHLIVESSLLLGPEGSSSPAEQVRGPRKAFSPVGAVGLQSAKLNRLAYQIIQKL